jgi:transcriptional regulator with XRE-family HTH domain
MEEWAGRLGVSRATVNNYETKKNAPLEILRAAAAIVDAPLEFMEHGWHAPPAADADLERRIAAIEARLNAPPGG